MNKTTTGVNNELSGEILMTDINIEIKPSEKREMRISAFGPSKDDGHLWLMINSVNSASEKGMQKTEALIKLRVNNDRYALELARAINAAMPAKPRESPPQPYRSPEPPFATDQV